MAFSVMTPGLRQAVRQVQDDVEGEVRVARSWAGHHICQAAVAQSEGLYDRNRKGAYDTGKQQRSYVYALSGDNIEIGNTATSPSGDPYPRYNEEQYGIMDNVVRRGRRQIVRRVQQAVDAGFSENRGSYRRANLRG